MTDRISGYKPAEPPAPVKGSGSALVDKGQAATAAAASNVGAAVDTVTLTSSAVALQKLGEAVAKAPVVNAQKVASVKQAIEKGSYKIDAGRVADKLLQFENGLN